MAHEIEGNYAFYASNQPAWHGLGTVLKDAPSVEQAWRIAYPHNLFKLPLSTRLEHDGGVEYAPITKACAIVRDDGKEIGVVGKDYELVQPYEAFKFFEPFIESGEVELEAGGSLRDGSRMWALSRVKGTIADVTANDPVSGYFLVYTSFDGSLSHGIQFTATRVVCANTLAIAMDAASKSNSVRLKHTKNIHERIEAVKTSVDIAKQSFVKSVGSYRALARKQMSRKSQEDYIKRVILDKQINNPEISTKLENKVQRVIELLDTQRGLDLVPAIRGTAWQAYNAVTEYLTHEYGRDQDSRLNAQWFGDSAKQNSQALQLALQ